MFHRALYEIERFSSEVAGGRTRVAIESRVGPAVRCNEVQSHHISPQPDRVARNFPNVTVKNT
jgi:hypothetical protein